MKTKDLLIEFEYKLIEQKYSISSIHNYLSTMGCFLQQNKNKYSNPLDITEKDIEEYLLWKIEKDGIGDSYQRLIVASIDKFYIYLFNIHLNIKHLYPRTKNKCLPVFLTSCEVSLLMDSVTNLKHKCIVQLLYGCGLRLNELLHLKLNDIDVKNKVIVIRNTNGGKNRKVMLSPLLLNSLKRYYKEYHPNEYLIEGQGGGKYTEKSVQVIVKNAAFKAGITKKVTPNTLRHSFAAHLLENGTDIHYIQELMGHKSINSTEIYRHITNIEQSKIKSPLDLLTL